MSKKHYIQLPHHHLSHSQRELWKTDRVRYAALYFDNREDLRVSNRGQEYGKIVADALEHQKETGDLLTDAAMLLLPKYDVRDVAFDVDIKTKDGWLNIIAKPDYLKSDTKEFIEIKTGTQPWTQTKAEQHPQLIFYAVAIWQKYGIMLDGCQLAWMETEYTPGSVKPTGRIEIFTVTFSKSRYLATLMDMINVAKEIELAWASHQPNPELTNF